MTHALQAAVEALETSIHAMRAPLDDWKGEVERSALDKANAALTACRAALEAQPQPPCTVCGVPWAKHGTYPTCSSHPYSPNGRCGHVGTYAGGTFTGAPCAGSECQNGCVAARGAEGKSNG